jgi:acyl-CoA reductase-like NAD-dependent aldehyde dehydrogenase
MTEATARRPEPSTIKPVLHYIDGEFRAGKEGRTFPTLDPATNQPITEVAEGLSEDIDEAVGALRVN